MKKFLDNEKDLWPAAHAHMNGSALDMVGGGGSYEKVQRYNFKSPNRFTKDHLRALRSIYEGFASGLSTHLSGLLRKPSHVELVSVEEHTFSEYSSSLINPVLLGIVVMPPFETSLMLEMTHTVSCTIIDRLLGGPGHYKAFNRNYTEIERALLEKLLGQFLEIMRESWSRFCDVEPVLERVETNSQFAQIATPNETIAIATLSATIGDVGGMINVCIPHMGIDKVFERIKEKNPQFKVQQSKQESLADEILKVVAPSALEVVCNFQDTEITAWETMNFRVGDVIMLNNKVDEPINVCIGNCVKFKGLIGTKNNRKAVRITEVVEGS